MLKYVVAIAGIAAFAALAVSPAQALTMKECSVKYKAAQDAGTLNGMKWNDFRKANCGADATAAAPAAAPAAKTAKAAPTPAVDPGEPSVTNTEHAAEPAAPSIVAPKDVVFPKAVDPQYASQSPGKARMHTCLDQYHINKTKNALGGLKWIQKGGGYYSLCNAKLKG
jgi:hypothetical protein